MTLRAFSYKYKLKAFYIKTALKGANLIEHHQNKILKKGSIAGALKKNINKRIKTRNRQLKYTNKT
ncbi:hypothetical protein CN602_24665 [Bacillus cereus]|nr:hypothetical protein CN602_24665 [Bacillus cereus]PQQ45793.1 hypothetical protein C6A34_18055 [Bacillus thuringiensis]